VGLTTRSWDTGSAPLTAEWDYFRLERQGDLPPLPPPSSPVTITYTYDPLYRLTNTAYSDGTSFAYTYDAVGNRLTQTACFGAGCFPMTTHYTYDAANRLITVAGTTNYLWDNNGNLLNDGTSTYAYDSANRLTSVSQNGNTYTFVYNGMGDRVRQTANGTPTTYTLDLNAGLTQVLADGANTYLYGNGRIAEYAGVAAEYYLGDALGSVRQLANGSAGVVSAKTYQPYGSVMGSAGSGATMYGFTGEQTDPTGLQYLRARFYAPGMGRFLTRDSWEGDANRPMSYNSWLYVYASPINFVDPTGQTPCSMLPPEDRPDYCNPSNVAPEITSYSEKRIPKNITFSTPDIKPIEIRNKGMLVTPGTDQSQFITIPDGFVAQIQ